MAKISAHGCTEVKRWQRITPSDPATSYVIVASKQTLTLRSDGALLQRLDFQEKKLDGRLVWARGSQNILAKKVKGFPDTSAVDAYAAKRGFEVA